MTETGKILYQQHQNEVQKYSQTNLKRKKTYNELYTKILLYHIIKKTNNNCKTDTKFNKKVDT